MCPGVGVYPSGWREHNKQIHEVKHHHQGNCHPLHKPSHCVGQLRQPTLILESQRTFSI